MSRIGKKPVAVPDGVTPTVDGQQVTVKGPKGMLSTVLVEQVAARLDEDGILIEPRDSSKEARSMWGMSRTLVSNLVEGVNTGFTRRLEINGVGYRAAVEGRNLSLTVGLSHPVVYPIPEGVDIQCPRPNEIVVSGIDRQRVGQVAAEIRAYRPPEPYKGKGIKYAEEFILRKEGKKK